MSWKASTHRPWSPGYDIPLSSKTLTATHNSFSHDRNISTHANFEVVTAQVYSMTDQLSCLGVRGLEIDLHYIDELAVEGDEESAIRMCHASEDVAEQMVDLCETFGWDVCEAADIFDYDEDTGCRPGAPTARAGFEEVASWLFLEENANEVLFLKLDSSLNDEDETVSTIVSDVFGEDVIFSPTDWEEFSGSDDWPSPAELVAMGTRVIIAGSESSTLVFSTDSDAVEVLISAEDFDTSECADVEGFPEPSWYRVQGDMVEYRLDRANSTIFELVPGSDEALTSSMTDNVMNCGFTPTFDRLDADLMESTIWSWDTDRPETGFDLPRAAVISSDGGRWTDVETDSDSGERHSFACRNSGTVIFPSGVRFTHGQTV
ncbi:conserved unknown protein [Ectocarpus siliculosus]|uniref:Uncharacterized protein n=1 Tax=Ectocarpus siliculosus TaxID=2880 RepID=D7FR16_ECTSI|nr:conserved unknown protein [Ectocarpus siliculosus]|eukprot:CBJ26170.1 conserved unknown protein [Ectocarpus siliculosus]